MTPAFKDWQPIVDALIAGDQILILRKGGIAEGPGGFQARAGRFWLFPTRFHAQPDKLKPGTPVRPAPEAPETAITLAGYAHIHTHAFLSDWDRVQALDPHHRWAGATVRERFTWSRPPGLHAFVVRAYRLRQPLRLGLTPAMAGCRSWIDLPLAFEYHASDPVLDDEAFAARAKVIGI